jgi:hypothetical protein
MKQIAARHWLFIAAISRLRKYGLEKTMVLSSERQTAVFFTLRNFGR